MARVGEFDAWPAPSPNPAAVAHHPFRWSAPLTSGLRWVVAPAAACARKSHFFAGALFWGFEAAAAQTK